MKTNKHITIAPENAKHEPRASFLRLRHVATILLLFSLFGYSKTAKAQTPVQLAPDLFQQYLDSSGAPLAGGCVFSYLAGTTTPTPTWSDFSGTFQNPNPVILDAAGRGPIWIGPISYRFVLFAAGGANCSAGTQIAVVDNVVGPLSANANNIFTGNNTFSGTTTFSGAVNINAGGSLAGAFNGNPTFTGTLTFTGSPIFTNQQAFPNGITTDSIGGISTAGGTLQVTGTNGSAGNSGENIGNTAGNGGVGSTAGGNFTARGGNGGSTGGNGGAVISFAGNASSGNFAGGGLLNSTGSGSGTGAGGDYLFQGGTGGSTAGKGGSFDVVGGTGGAGGNGGDISLAPGPKGAGGLNGNLILGGSGTLGFNVSPTAVAPTCASSGLGAGTCTLANFSTDSSGVVVLTAGAGASTAGIVTITFNQTMGANGSFCQYTLTSSSGVWDPRATVIGTGGGSLTNLFSWDDNAVALTPASIYNVSYFCRGEQ